MGRIPERVVEAVRERADIVQVVGRHVTLKRSGRGYLGLCPFHDEKTPSFHVHSDRQFFHCFGCGAGGDVFTFLMRHDGADFIDAVKTLAGELGIEIPRSDGAAESRSEKLYRVNERALDYFRSSLRSTAGTGARTYLDRRGVPTDLVDRFQIGFAPARWDGLLGWLRDRGDSLAPALEVGLVAEKQAGDGHYDRLRGRIVFPISEPGGRVVGFGGRVFAEHASQPAGATHAETGPKYLNSPESPIYHKGRALFGLALAVDSIRRRGRAVVVEGYFDLIALHRAGIQEGVAPCGTALTEDHARRLRRYTREVTLLFDGDDAGQRAAERSLPVLLGAGLRVRAAFLPDGMDPDTLLEARGEAALRACVDAAVPLLDHLIETKVGMRERHGWDSADVVRAIAPLVRAVPEALEREPYVREVAKRLSIRPDSVDREVRRADPSRARVELQGAERAPAPAEAVGLEPAVRDLIGALTAYPELVGLTERLLPDALPPGDGGWLLGRVIEVMRDRGAAGLAHLLSPAADELPDGFKRTLAEVAARFPRGSDEQAAQCARGCIAKLRVGALEREAQEVARRLETCNARSDEEPLLERQQEIAKERSALMREIR